MDTVDKRLLDIIQADFPISPRPYADLATQVLISEQEAFERVMELKRRGLIRRLGANFQSTKLGFCSTLCAAKVPDAQLDAFVAEVNACPGVTHNYLRDHKYNVWFTLISPSPADMASTLDEISAKTGIAILNLPAAKMFKIKVAFPMGG